MRLANGTSSFPVPFWSPPQPDQPSVTRYHTGCNRKLGKELGVKLSKNRVTSVVVMLPSLCGLEKATQNQIVASSRQQMLV